MRYISKFTWFVMLVLLVGNVYALPTAKITIKVIDENGLPIEGAKVAADFSVGSSSRLDNDITDSEGLATLSNSGIRHVEYGADKEGYYRSGNEYDFKSISGFTGFRKWQPWNETLTLVLKEIKNPRALYIGNNKSGSSIGDPISIPGLDKNYGFDLIAQDWVVPYGQGTHRDFIFKMTGQITGRNEYDYILTLSFSNDGDGIQKHDVPPRYGSHLRLPHEAPENGYENELVQRKARSFTHFIHNDFPEDRNYFFRVRTQKDDNGNIESALYGKIYGNIGLSISKSISMLYYLNPDSNDRNLESDYKKNLFPSKQKYGYTEYHP